MASNKENPRMARTSLPVSFQRPQQLDILDNKASRRSHAPRKSILKFNNANDDTTQELDPEINTYPGDMRKSLARRVSFAAHAQVRLYNKESNPDGTSSPTGTPAAASAAAPVPPARRSSLRTRRSSAAKPPSAGGGVTDDWEEGGSSMEIDDDEVNAQLYVAGDQLEGDSQDFSEDAQGEGDEMEMTTVFSNEIIVTNARRRSSMAGASGSAHQRAEGPTPPSPAQSVQTEGSEAMEFTVALEQSILPSKRASLANEAWAQLQGLQNQSRDSNQASPSNEMDVQDAMKRMLAASTSTAKRAALAATGDTGEDESMDMSLDESMQVGGSSNYREDQTMDFTSIVQGRLSIHREREEELSGMAPQLMDNPFLMPPSGPSRESSAAPPVFPASSFTFNMHSASTAPDADTPIPGQSGPGKDSITPSEPPLWLSQGSLPTFSRTSNNLSKSSSTTSAAVHPAPQPNPSSAPVIQRSKIPSPSKRLVPAPTQLSATPTKLKGPSTMTGTLPPGTPRRHTPSRPTTPSRAAGTPSRGIAVGTPTQTSSTPSRKRPSSPSKTASPSKRLAVENDAGSQRAVSVEPRSSSEDELLTPTEVVKIVERETSAPPELSALSNASGRRSSSSFAQRRAKKNSLAPAFGGLGTIAEVRESLGKSLGTGPSVVERTGMEVSLPAVEEVGVEVTLAAAPERAWDEYEQPLALSGTAQGSVPPQGNRSFGERPRIGVAEFLDMVGIHFHETMPVQRRHTLGPDVMTLEDGTLGPLPLEGHEFSLADYYRAEAVDLAQMDIYLWAISEIKTQMADHKAELALLEEEIEENPPAAILDFLEADAEVRPQIEIMFKLAKSYAKRLTRGNWYRWRTQWTKDLQPHVDEEIQNLETHIGFVKEQRESLREPVDELRRMHASLKADLEKERNTVAEIEACDPEQLEGLKAGIMEQNSAIEGYKTEISQAVAELDRCKGQLKERQLEYQAAQDVVAASKRRGEMLGTTREDVLRRKAWFETLQDLHGWQVRRVTPSVLELVHLTLHLLVALPLERFQPLLQGLVIEPLPLAKMDEGLKNFPAVVDALVKSATLVRSGSLTTHREIVRYLDTTWASYNLVLVELQRLWIKHPLKVSLLGDGSMKVVVTMLLRPKSKPGNNSKLVVTFTFGQNLLARWPSDMASLGLEVYTAYGPVESSEVKTVIRDRLADSTPEQHYGSLFDACGEVTAKWGV